MTNKQEEWKEFETLAKPLIKYLCDKHHPHMTILITCTTAELLEGLMSVHTNEFIRD